MNGLRITGRALVPIVLLLLWTSGQSAGRPVQAPPEGYEHTKFAPEPDILKEFHGFAVSFDSKDDDDGDDVPDLLRVPHWVGQEIRRWEPDDQDDDDSWCLDTLKRPKWFTDKKLYRSGVAGNDDSYLHSGFDRGHMAMKLLVERLGQDAAYNTFTVLNAIPQRARFNSGIWQSIELLTGAWAQTYDRVWVIQGPVFYDLKTLSWIGDEGERKVAIPDAVFKIVIRFKTAEEQEKAAVRDKEAPVVLAFLYPQVGPGYTGPRDEFRHARFLTTIDEIEKLTSLNFKLSDDPSVEKRLERTRANELWEPSTVVRKQRRTFVSACKRS